MWSLEFLLLCLVDCTEQGSQGDAPMDITDPDSQEPAQAEEAIEQAMDLVDTTGRKLPGYG